MATPYHAAVRVVPLDQTLEPEQAGPIVIEIIVRVQPDAGSTVPSAPGDLLTDPDDDGVVTLSMRERQVLQLVAQHYSNRMIAGALTVTEGTVKRYLQRIFAKLDVRTRHQAVEVAGRTKRAA
jgi:ATP/maltotriose-dependent transcriptional regulator MalT